METKTTHTPGPWTTQPIGDETECNILGAGRELIATVSDNDAKVIAAAPDMLAALKRFARAMEQGNYPEMQGVACDAFEAIRKAEGGA